jgi:hypothetical protein
LSSLQFLIHSDFRDIFQSSIPSDSLPLGSSVPWARGKANGSTSQWSMGHARGWSRAWWRATGDALRAAVVAPGWDRVTGLSQVRRRG